MNFENLIFTWWHTNWYIFKAISKFGNDVKIFYAMYMDLFNGSVSVMPLSLFLSSHLKGTSASGLAFSVITAFLLWCLYWSTIRCTQYSQESLGTYLLPNSVSISARNSVLQCHISRDYLLTLLKKPFPVFHNSLYISLHIVSSGKIGQMAHKNKLRVTLPIS